MERIVDALRAFARAHPAYGTVDGARDRCREASGLFFRFLVDRGFADARVDELDVVDGVAHKAVLVDGCLWVDWTARQFDPGAPFPELIFDDRGEI